MICVARRFSRAIFMVKKPDVNPENKAMAVVPITAIPTVFIVDKEGTIRAHLVGGRSEKELVAALERAGLDTGP